MPLPYTHTKIFLDSGSSVDTKVIYEKLGFLDGQTTNPTYFVKKNPDIKEAVAQGKKFTTQELLSEYKKLAQAISVHIPQGSVSIEVYADKHSTAEELIAQGREMYTWIPNAHIKLPIIPAGLKAAHTLVNEGKRVNMTLCFSQEQAAAVHAATKGALPGQVFLSPFMSRLDTIGQNGRDLLAHIQQMYHESDSHVEILAASVHSVSDIAHIIEKNIDIITIPYNDMLAWIEAGTPISTEHVTPKDTSTLSHIAYERFDLSAHYSSFDISHELTTKGLTQFAHDWNAILKN